MSADTFIYYDMISYRIASRDIIYSLYMARIVGTPKF